MSTCKGIAPRTKPQVGRLTYLFADLLSLLLQHPLLLVGVIHNVLPPNEESTLHVLDRRSNKIYRSALRFFKFLL